MMPAHPPPTLKSMSTFDPSQPALLHDRLNDEIFAWLPEKKDEWLRNAQPAGEGVIGWDGLLIDGWCEPLGG
jgi:hypothetical protein